MFQLSNSFPFVLYLLRPCYEMPFRTEHLHLDFNLKIDFKVFLLYKIKRTKYIERIWTLSGMDSLLSLSDVLSWPGYELVLVFNFSKCNLSNRITSFLVAFQFCNLFLLEKNLMSSHAYISSVSLWLHAVCL